MTKHEMIIEIERILNEEIFYFGEPEYDGDEPFYSTYIGSFMSLDPCGRYHHFLSPNGITKKCEQYWENLNTAAESKGCWIDTALNGDLCDMFLCTNDKPKHVMKEDV